ncbi:hypothetical protein HF086_006415 [Spodoptera exigua]|uniref:Uncharacterized protein n=1 Tax=Spodoptera exigua TaxID=7107 RepID=A0A922SMX1_SPOEX|nr:hypothetical protein HF086_006415 [Spodoptera exigua]
MQSIHEDIKPTGVHYFIVLNWVVVTIFILIVASAFILVGICVRYYDNFKTVCEILMISFEVDFIYSIRILILLNKYVGHWIKEIGLMSNDREDDEVYCKKKFATYQNILEAFNVYKVLYEVLVSLSVIVEGQEKLCVDVIRENRKFCKLTACGLFHVDAKLPLSFLEYFTSYAIVLIQFAFL